MPLNKIQTNKTKIVDSNIQFSKRYNEQTRFIAH